MTPLERKRFEMRQRGPSFKVRLLFFVGICLILLKNDHPNNAFLGGLRSAISLLIQPIQDVLLVPKLTYEQSKDYITDVHQLNQIKSKLADQVRQLAPLAQRTQMVENESARLRAALRLTQVTPFKLTPSVVLYEARNPMVRKLIIDKGSLAGVKQGAPVIDESGVVGQITRVKPTESELTLLIDANQPIPIQIARNGIRGIAYGSSRFGHIELRYIPLHADILEGDVLMTSGLDGIYPPGLAVAKVHMVDKKTDPSFLKVYGVPLASIFAVRNVFVVNYTPPKSELFNEQQNNQPAIQSPTDVGLSDQSSDGTTTP